MSNDAVFNSLPTSLQRKIDRAFDATVLSDLGGHPQSTRPAHSVASEGTGSGGGFIIEDSTESIDPSFTIEADTEASNDNVRPTQINMSSIPAALQRLDLPPDDEQVLSVFRNAASGWSSSSSNATNNINMTGGTVSRDDWRAVCAVLLEHHDEEYEDDSEGGIMDDTANDYDGDMDMDDQYIAPSDSDNNDSDDEYTEGPPAASSRRGARARIRKSASNSSLDPSSPSQPKRLTPRQKQTCFDAFALFFPSIPISELSDQRIMIKDIQRVSKVLGEKLKADEMVDMLDAFSSAPDKSMGLADFERMMVKAKLA